MSMENKNLENAAKAVEHDISDADKILEQVPLKADYSPEEYKAMEHNLGDTVADAVSAHVTPEEVKEAVEVIEEEVSDVYKSIEKGVVGTYHKIEDAVVGAYQKIEDGFVEKVLAKPGETVEEAKKRVTGDLKKK